MERLVDILFFFLRASSIAFLVYLLFRTMHFQRTGGALLLKEDSNFLWGLVTLVVFATLVYSWFV